LTTNGSEPEPEQVLCLFIVVVDLDGSSRAILNPTQRFVAQRESSPKDVYPACANVMADFQGLKAAEAIMSFQAQIARQMAESQAAGEAPDNSSPPL
jgi:hypothetical protein